MEMSLEEQVTQLRDIAADLHRRLVLERDKATLVNDLRKQVDNWSDKYLKERAAHHATQRQLKSVANEMARLYQKVREAIEQ